MLNKYLGLGKMKGSEQEITCSIHVIAPIQVYV